MINGVVNTTTLGVPQGGNLSPLLSNIMLNELDKELTKRGLKFARYADDCNIYVKSKKAADRVWKKVSMKFKNLKKLEFLNKKHGNLLIQEKGIGEFPIALSYQLLLLMPDSEKLD